VVLSPNIVMGSGPRVDESPAANRWCARGVVNMWVTSILGEAAGPPASIGHPGWMGETGSGQVCPFTGSQEGGPDDEAPDSGL
jgi:hypothetical protein